MRPPPQGQPPPNSAVRRGWAIGTFGQTVSHTLALTNWKARQPAAIKKIADEMVAELP